MKYRKVLFINLVLCLLFASCGQVSNDLNEIDEPVVQNSSNEFFLKGTVDSVDDDTIVIDGVVCDISNATITLQGENESDIQLDSGMTVSIRCRSTEEEGLMIASEVDVYFGIKGIIETIDPEKRTIEVMGSTVYVTEDTRLRDNTSSDIIDFSVLAPDNVVQVSGYLNADGDIIATHIKVESEKFIRNGSKLEVTGEIASLGPEGMTFIINDIMINYTNAEIKNAPSEGLSVGLRVEVESTEEFTNNVLIADEVKILEDCFEAENEKIEGIITVDNMPDGFTLNTITGSQRVKVDENTTYKFGSSVDIKVNAFITLKGILDGDVILLAQQIEFKIPNNIQIVSPSDYIDIDIEDDEITILGIPISLADTTMLCENPRKCSQLTTEDIENLHEEDRLKVSAFQFKDNDIINTIVTEIYILKGHGDDVSLKGPVDPSSINSSAGTFSILSVSIQTFDDNTEFKVKTDDPDADPREVFFATITKGSIVEAGGIFDDAGGFILADTVELDE